MTDLAEMKRLAEARVPAWQMAVDGAGKTAWEQGRLAGIDEAAKVADDYMRDSDKKFDGLINASQAGERNLELAGAASAGMSHAARRIAAAIRARGE